MKTFGGMTSQELADYTGPLYSYSVLFMSQKCRKVVLDGDCATDDHRRECIASAIGWGKARGHYMVEVREYMRTR